MKFWHLLPLVVTISHLQSCQISFRPVEIEDYYDEYELEEGVNITRDALVGSISVTCRNVSSLARLQHHTHPYPEHEKFLTIAESNIPTIPPSAFLDPLTIELTLSGNHIKFLSRGAFDNLTRLERLHLDDNEIEELPKEVFRDLLSLKLLNLTDNRISKIDHRVLFGLAHLEQLDLESNRLVRLENDVQMGQVRLFRLKLSGNPLESLSLDIPSLRELFVTETSLKEFDLGNMKVAVLRMSHGMLSEMSTCLLPEVTFELDLSFNRISSGLNFSLKQKSLDKLDLSNNNITKIDRTWFKHLYFLVHLNLSHNNIEDFQFGTFDSLSRLNVLDISYNKLTSLHEYAFHPLTMLTQLYLTSNQISVLNVEDLTHSLISLRFIALDQNLFSCRHLVKIKNFLRSRSIVLFAGDSFEGDNVKGISCSGTKDHDVSLSSRVLQKIINDSKSLDFSNREDSGRSMLIFSCALQVLQVSFLLVILLCFVCFYLKRFKINRSSTSSLMELS